MLTLLSSLLGFLASVVPQWFEARRSDKEMAHELAMLDKQIEAQAKLGTQHLEEVAIGADVATYKDIYKTYRTGVKWVDAFNGTVRPTIAYAFFLLYASIKVAQFYLLLHPVAALPWLGTPNLGIAQALIALWSEEDMCLFAGILSFYYGNRYTAKMKSG